MRLLAVSTRRRAQLWFAVLIKTCQNFATVLVSVCDFDSTDVYPNTGLHCALRGVYVECGCGERLFGAQ